MVLLGVTLALLTISVGAVPLPNANTTQLEQAVSYLIRFGHTDHNKINKQDKAGALATISSDLKGFQKFAGLKETGDLDEATVKKLQEPRCGVKDNVGRRTRKTGRRKRWTLHGSRWSVRDLSYSIENAPSSVQSIKYTNGVLGDALDTWAREANINFKKIKANQGARIQIKFVRGYHGDGDPFDGPRGTLAHAFFPIYGGNAHFDDDEPWSINSRHGSNMYVAATHEFGHSLGLAHSQINSMMSPWYQKPQSPASRGLLAQDDIDAIQILYGKRPRNSPGPPARNPGPEVRPQRGGGFGRPSWDADTRPQYPFGFSREGGRRRNHRRGWGNGYGVWRSLFGFIEQKADGADTPAGEETNVNKAAGDERLCTNGSLDAVLTVTGTTYVFQGDHYWRLTATAVAAGYPRKISADWNGVVSPLDAALYSKASKRIYMFKGDKVWAFSTELTVESGYPKLISAEFPGMADRYLSAAFEWGKDGLIYMVKGSQYWKQGTKGPKPLSQWSGLPATIDAATQYSNGKTYFFRDQKYYRFDDLKFKVDETEQIPFPRNTGIFWFGCQSY